MKAFITGITGQDGYYLAKLLLDKGYEVHGLVRRSSSMDNRKHIDDLDVQLHYGDMTDALSLDRVISTVSPDEIYNLAAQSHVGVSFVNPSYTFQANTIGTLNILEFIRKFNDMRSIKLYQASTSEMFGREQFMVTEKIPFTVNSPYAVSKLAAHELCNIYKKAYNMFVSCGLLFNHESPKRGENFVTRKITLGLCRMKKRLINVLHFGNIYAKRDWGFAGDYVEAMWLMLQQEQPDDYIIATGETHSVKEFIDQTCFVLDMNIEWTRNDTIGIVWSGSEHVGVIHANSKQARPLDVEYLKGDSTKARLNLKWKPKINFKQLITLMVHHDLIITHQEKERLV